MSKISFKELIFGRGRRDEKAGRRKEDEEEYKEGEGLPEPYEEEDEDDYREYDSCRDGFFLPMILSLCVLAVVVCVATVGIFPDRKSDEKQGDMSQTEIMAAASGENLMMDTRHVLQEEKPKEELSARNVYFAGIEDSVFYGEGRIALDNLEENEDFLMRYEVYDEESGKLIFETGLIPSGERVYFEPYSVLKPGVYQLRFTAVPYMEQNGGYLALTSGSNEVTIELKERSADRAQDQQKGEVYEENEETY